MELPPRTRRILEAVIPLIPVIGTTSAYAENTIFVTPFDGLARNYLRVRGEYHPSPRRCPHHAELPPRTRRIRPPCPILANHRGTTSAYAENTTLVMWVLCGMWNYLRVRGEYAIAWHVSRWILELPPRTRRILTPEQINDTMIGTTSAYAENTPAAPSTTSMAWNYLRVRGEYSIISCFSSGTKELPPRTRRIPPTPCFTSHYIGTTSAYAENTAYHRRPHHHRRNYLRVRGEYVFKSSGLSQETELPPRTRRIRGAARKSHGRFGTTSAYAENTLNELGLL